MALMKSLLCTAALMLIVEFQQAGAQRCGNFQQTCTDISYGSNGVLSAQCAANSGVKAATSIDLNGVIGNVHGVLQDGVDFTQTCPIMFTCLVNLPGAQPNVLTLLGLCSYANGNSINPTSFPLGTAIGNNNGVLTWQYCI